MTITGMVGARVAAQAGSGAEGLAVLPATAGTGRGSSAVSWRQLGFESLARQETGCLRTALPAARSQPGGIHGPPNKTLGSCMPTKLA